MKLYICDMCKDEFRHPISEVQVESRGKTESIDFCSRCREEVEESVKKFRKDKLESILSVKGQKEVAK